MVNTSRHHAVYGVLNDYLTGWQLRDTDDERYRQKLERFFVEEKGFSKQELEPRLFIETVINNQYVKSTIELTFSLFGERLMILRYGPGSLVTRERPTVAAARLLEPQYAIPLAIITNGHDAELLDTSTGKVLHNGLNQLPNRDQLAAMYPTLALVPFTDEKMRDREKRILNVYDLEVCCRDSNCAP
ncbi:MAG: type I restriction enzyme HsdR N-terminal domain-containing protein [Desulfobulbaceae bacterium]|nr:type I restriction enzyme HsdR N-terminal domain-containing protein [Desulfobulbaceae bacterium]